MSSVGDPLTLPTTPVRQEVVLFFHVTLEVDSSLRPGPSRISVKLQLKSDFFWLRGIYQNQQGPQFITPETLSVVRCFSVIRMLKCENTCL